jgi:hypothetical protein
MEIRSQREHQQCEADEDGDGAHHSREVDELGRGCLAEPFFHFAFPDHAGCLAAVNRENEQDCQQSDGQVHAPEAGNLILNFHHRPAASLGSSKSLVDQGGEGNSVPPPHPTEPGWPDGFGSSASKGPRDLSSW